MYLDFNDNRTDNKAAATRDVYRGLELADPTFEPANFTIEGFVNEETWNWREISNAFSGDNPESGFECSIAAVGDMVYYIGTGQIVRISSVVEVG